MTPEKTLPVLVVNDDQNLSKLWRHIIDKEADMHCCAVADDGQQAVELALAHRPQVILMDAMLPIMNGFDATREILNHLPDTRVIIYSAFAGTRNPSQAAGAVDYLIMPVTPDQLLAAIRRSVSDSVNQSNKGQP